VELGGTGFKELLTDRAIIGDALVKVVIESELVKKQVE
jgi:hypothetical protein